MDTYRHKHAFLFGKQKSTHDLFDVSICDICSEKSFSESILTDTKLNKTLEKLHFLSTHVECFRDIENAANAEPGTVYVFEVDVMCQKNKLEVRERNPLKRETFFDLDPKKTTRVILIFNKAVRAIEAKLVVHKKYESLLNSSNVLLHHECEDIDEISKFSGRQKLAYLSSALGIIDRGIPVDDLPDIVQNAVETVLTKENVRRICHYVNLGNGVGTVGSRPYVCQSVFTVNSIKKDLAKKTMETLVRALGDSICQGILSHIKDKIEQNLNEQFKGIEIHFSEETKSKINDVFGSIASFCYSFFGAIADAISTTFMAAYVFINTVNINSWSWRTDVADQVYAKISEKEESILEETLPCLTKLCVRTKNELKAISRKVHEQKDGITLTDQKIQLEQWKKREVIKDRKALTDTCPSFLNYIAGKKNGRSVVVVFLQNGDKEKAKQYFTENSQLPDAEYEIVNVNTDFKEKPYGFGGEILKSLEKNKRKEMKEMKEIIRDVQQHLLSIHSNLIGLGVGFTTKWPSEPCLVLHCVDKSLVPFGEKHLPDSLGGYPVELRDDFVMFGKWLSSQSLHDASSGIKPFLSKGEGSVHCRVKAREKSLSLLESGLITPEQIAPVLGKLYQEGALSANDCLLEKEDKTIHPSFFQNESKKILKDTGFKSDTKAAELMSACLTFLKGKSIDRSDLQVAGEDEDDLPDGEICLTKTGQPTMFTNRKLLEVGSSVAIDLPYTAGVFVCFQNCYILRHIDDTLSTEDDLGSGVYVKSLNQSNKALGVAVAIFSNKKQTVVCNIEQVLDTFNVFIYEKHDSKTQEPSKFLLQKKRGSD